MTKPLAGKVCLVTGATRGIGKGIALQLGENGAKVYITGRTMDQPRGSKLGGSLRETADQIETRGGQCIPVKCDHGNDEEVERLFEQIRRENDNQLDLLVNNAYSAVGVIFDNIGVKFWEQPISMWDEINKVGLRNHYLCSIYAARLMVPRKQGLGLVHKNLARRSRTTTNTFRNISIATLLSLHTCTHIPLCVQTV